MKTKALVLSIGLAAGVAACNSYYTPESTMRTVYGSVVDWAKSFARFEQDREGCNARHADHQGRLERCLADASVHHNNRQKGAFKAYLHGLTGTAKEQYGSQDGIYTLAQTLKGVKNVQMSKPVVDASRNEYDRYGFVVRRYYTMDVMGDSTRLWEADVNCRVTYRCDGPTRGYPEVPDSIEEGTNGGSVRGRVQSNLDSDKNLANCDCPGGISPRCSNIKQNNMTCKISDLK